MQLWCSCVLAPLATNVDLWKFIDYFSKAGYNRFNSMGYNDTVYCGIISYLVSCENGYFVKLEV